MIVFRSIFHFFLTCRDFLYCKLYLGVYDSTWRFWGLPELSRFKGSTIEIGSNYVACSLSTRNSIGMNQNVVLKTTTEEAEIIIGDNVGMSGCTVSCAKFVHIGNNCLIGSGVLIIDSDQHPIHPSFRKLTNKTLAIGVSVGDDVFIGARSIILKGVRIGRGSVVGAGSVVTKSLPEMCIAAGNPAKVVRYIEDFDGNPSMSLASS